MSLEDLELTDLSNELSVRSVVRDILTSQDQNRPKFNYNSVKTLMVRKYGSNAFERVKPVVGKSHTHYISRNESITYQTMTQYQSWRRSQEFRKTHSTSSRNCLMWRVRYLSWIKSWRDWTHSTCSPRWERVRKRSGRRVDVRTIVLIVRCCWRRKQRQSRCWVVCRNMLIRTTVHPWRQRHWNHPRKRLWKPIHPPRKKWYVMVVVFIFRSGCVTVDVSDIWLNRTIHGSWDRIVPISWFFEMIGSHFTRIGHKPSSLILTRKNRVIRFLYVVLERLFQRVFFHHSSCTHSNITKTGTWYSGSNRKGRSGQVLVQD